MIKALSAIVIAGTTVMCTAIVHAVYGLFWLGRDAIDGAAPSFDWFGALLASALATAVVLLASTLAQQLLSAWPDNPLGPRTVRIPVRVTSRDPRLARTRR